MLTNNGHTQYLCSSLMFLFGCPRKRTKLDRHYSSCWYYYLSEYLIIDKQYVLVLFLFAVVEDERNMSKILLVLGIIIFIYLIIMFCYY